MKIAVMADCHINKSTYSQVKDKILTHLPFRAVDHMKAMESSIDEIIKLAPDVAIIVGDVYDNFYPTSDISAFFNAQLTRLRKASIPSIIMVGNHDVCKRHHALLPLKELDLEDHRVIDAPTMIKMGDHIFILFPYSLDVEQDKISIKKQFDEFISDVKQDIMDDPSASTMKVLFFGHFGVQGASLNQYSDKPSGLITEQSIRRIVKHNFRNNSESAITVNDLDNIGAEYVFLGDYHRHQVLPTTACKAMYTGSIERSDINEMGQKKGFIFYDSEAEEEKKLGKCRFIEYKNCRPFVELRGAWSDIKQAAKQIGEEQKNAIVKISFVGNKSQMVECSAGLEKLKNYLVDKISPVHIMYEQHLIDEQETKEATTLQQEIVDNGYLQDAAIMDVLGEIITDMEQDLQERDELKTLAKTIYDEAQAQ